VQLPAPKTKGVNEVNTLHQKNQATTSERVQQRHVVLVNYLFKTSKQTIKQTKPMGQKKRSSEFIWEISPKTKDSPFFHVSQRQAMPHAATCSALL
jgi:hypothetical protein